MNRKRSHLLPYPTSPTATHHFRCHRTDETLTTLQDNEIDEYETDEDEDDEEKDEAAEARPLRPAALQLAVLISPKGGRKVGAVSAKNARRRVTRKGGIAAKTAALFEQVLEEVNTARCLGQEPFTLADVLVHMEEGKRVLAAATSTKDDRIMAEAVKKIVTSAGRSSKAAVVGMLAASNAQGQLSLDKVVAIAGVSKSHVSNSRAKHTAIGPKPFATFTDQNMVRGVKRTGVPDMELV